MNMIKLCSFAPGQNLATLRRQLDERGLDYQVRETAGVAELWVVDRQLDAAAGVLDQLRRPTRTPAAGATAAAVLRTWPLTLVTVALGCCGFLLAALRPDWLGYLTFTAVDDSISYLVFHSLAETYAVKHEWWRLLTPAFLHFGIWHILFNALAMWELGRRIEFVLPWRWYVAILLVTALAANVAQHALSGADIFGGLSGVVFGLFGVIAPLHKRSRSPVLDLPRGVYVLALVSLVVLPMVLESAVGIHVANGAHVGGLVAGLLFGVLIPVRRLRQVQLPNASLSRNSV